MVANADDALRLIEALCSLPANRNYVQETIAWVRSSGIAVAVAEHDTPALYRWLMHGFSYQGISDGVAAGYIARHGNADYPAVAASLAAYPSPCPKLASFEAYVGCAYRKTGPSCANLEALPCCPVPSLPLRKGILNEQAFSLYLFIRDRAGGDLVGFIDAILDEAANDLDPEAAGREALLTAFSAISGISTKLVSVMLAVLLIGADPSRTAWVAVGQSMLAVDSLVHNFMHRTGIAKACGVEHRYGQRCYGEHGCEATLRELARRFDASTINASYPTNFPRLVQHAIWRFCAVGEINICNGRNVDDGQACELQGCPLWARCSRLPVRGGTAREGL